MPDAIPPNALDFAARIADLDADGLTRRAAVSLAAARRAETLAGVALERLATQAPARGKDPEAAGSLADGCAPTLTGLIGDAHAFMRYSRGGPIHAPPRPHRLSRCP